MKTFIQAVIFGLACLSLVGLADDLPQPRYSSKPEYRALFLELEKAEVIAEGVTDTKSIVYVFFDPNCLYCNLTWKALQPYEKVGLQVRWVPVAYQKPSSVGRVAAIMEAANRAAALRENEVNYDAAHFDGGIKPLGNSQTRLMAKLQINLKLMRKFGVPATPLLVWKDSNGNVRVKAGVPRLSQLPGITGLPAQNVDDPELADFR